MWQHVSSKLAATSTSGKDSACKSKVVVAEAVAGMSSRLDQETLASSCLGCPFATLLETLKGWARQLGAVMAARV